MPAGTLVTILKKESERGRLQLGAFALFPVAAAGFRVQTVY
jgi:hypothetical protein